MPRAKVYGYIAVSVSIFLFLVIINSIFNNTVVKEIFFSTNINNINHLTYYSIAVPIGSVSLFLIGTGFWIGYTILNIKVVPPMPEMSEKKDYSKAKALLLCLTTLILAFLLIYGIFTKNFWSLAIPALLISLVILGAVFWVGLAIITTRTTLPEKNE